MGVDGVLLLDKMSGITSNAALQRVKRLLRAVKAGHVGTLDPLASGLLPVCLGEATKFSSGMFFADKAYDADIALGITTATGDSEGDVISRQPVSVTAAEVAAVLPRFVGVIAQTPPMYSALKRGGKPLYAYAREGRTVELTPRPVTIHAIELLGLNGDRLRCHVRCGKGTYIRVLAGDIGRALGCGASLAGLRRVSVGEFDVVDAVTLGQLEAMTQAERDGCLHPVDSMLAGLPSLVLQAEDASRVVTGQACQLRGSNVSGPLRLYADGGRFLGVGEMSPEGKLAPKRLVAATAGAAAVT